MVRTRIGDGDGIYGDGHRDEVTSAVRQLLEPWTASSNGRVSSGVRRGRRRCAAPSASCTLAGAPRRRRCPRLARLGRFERWGPRPTSGRRDRAVRCLVVSPAPATATSGWSIPTIFGELAGELGWWWWDAGEPALGWELQLAIDDPVEGLAWAISAHDAH
ncbi:MAG: hypothetical protein R2713_23230 [Ilumatobacteraceae bacterium]